MPTGFDLVCLSHLRWSWVYQRPQHLLSRAGRERRVFFVEEAFWCEGPPHLRVRQQGTGVLVAAPHMPESFSEEERTRTQRALLDELLREHNVRQYVLWYYSPMAMPFSDHLKPLATVYDCMDELSAFAHAPTTLSELETRLLRRADLVFAGGQSLYEAKAPRHHSVHLFKSSVDVAHFSKALETIDEPADQAGISRPRLGYCGVIDERLDLDLLEAVANARPEWQLVIVGPVAKIQPDRLPRRDNIHYLGLKDYSVLPAYIAGWDAALMPFARNEATRYISPTKTPEYLAAGRAVVSTPIRDVVRPYGDVGLVHIAEAPGEFIAAIERALSEDGQARQKKVDAFLAHTSWDRTWGQMRSLIETHLAADSIDGPGLSRMADSTGLEASSHGRTPARTGVE